METERVAISKIVPDPANVRKHSKTNLDAIKASLSRFGQQKPIVIDENNVVRAGNGTLMAATELGWEEIAIVRSELAGSEMTAFAIADNRTSELAEWDTENLVNVLNSLEEEAEGTVKALGFEEGFVTIMKEQMFASALSSTDMEVEAFNPRQFDEERGIDRIPAPLMLQIVCRDDDMDVVREATKKYQEHHPDAARDVAVIGIIREWLGD